MYKERNRRGIKFIYQLPIYYGLSSGKIKGEEAYKQAKDLIKNMEYHLNHKNFIKGYDIDLKKFNI